MHVLPERLRWVNERTRGEHRFLTVADHCLYFGEFSARGGWAAGATNQLIVDYKRTPLEIAASVRARALRFYKERAVRDIAIRLRRAFSTAAVEGLITFVPIPSSKRVGAPDHCDRLLRTLRLAFGGLAADIRPLLRQSESTPADHRAAGRLSLRALLALTEIDATQLARPLRPLVVLFDDVLTSGKHVAVAKTRILEQVSEQPIIAVLVARRVREEPAA